MSNRFGAGRGGGVGVGGEVLTIKNIYDHMLKQEGPEALNRSPDYTGQKSNI